MNILVKFQNHMNTILLLRGVAIIIQVVLIFLVSQGLNYQLPSQPLITIISIEVLFTLACYLYYRADKTAAKSALFIQVLADVLFLSLLLYFSGGATNAFVSLLLIPIAIAAVTLPLWMLAVTASLAIVSYSVMLWLMPMSVMHGNMQGHFIGMWINFLFSAMVVALVVANLARSINSKELAIAKYREEQLKQEKIIALGIASAQVTHQLATPLATALLLVDELNEELAEQKNNETADEIAIVIDLQSQLQRCSQSLHDFRALTFDIKNQVAKPISTTEIVQQLKDYIQLNFPEILLTVNVDKESSYGDKNSDAIDSGKSESSEHNIYYIQADGALLPAIINLVNNGVRASKANNSRQLVLSVSANKNQLWQLSIRDFGTGFTQQKLTKLGVEPVDSEQGFGMAVFLSHASLERLGGKITLTNHHEGGALVLLELPIKSAAGNYVKTRKKHQDNVHV